MRNAFIRGLTALAERLTAEFGKGFDASNLRYMRLFYQAFPICDALRHELSWTHYRTLLRVEDRTARHWYMAEACAQNWGTRALERQIGTLYYERLLASRDRQPVREEAARKVAETEALPREFVRDPVLLEFLGLPWDPQVLGYRDRLKTKAVSSPTYEAVSQPLYTSAIGRWKNYRKYLEPCQKILQSCLDAFAYESA